MILFDIVDCEIFYYFRFYIFTRSSEFLDVRDAERYLGLPCFLAVQNSSIGDLVPCLVGWSVTTEGSLNQIHDPGIWALPVKGRGGLNPCLEGLGHFF